MGAILRTHEFTVEDFHRMADAGILCEDDRVELLEGDIIDMTPVGPRHAACVRRLTTLLTQQVGTKALVSVQNPVQTAPHSQVYPDVTLLRPRQDSYSAAHPGPTDVILVIEVADTSLQADRQDKIPHYAQVGIPEVWLVDIQNDRVERYRHPSGDRYESVRSYGRGAQLDLDELLVTGVPIDDILP